MGTNYYWYVKGDEKEEKLESLWQSGKDKHIGKKSFINGGLFTWRNVKHFHLLIKIANQSPDLLCVIDEKLCLFTALNFTNLSKIVLIPVSNTAISFDFPFILLFGLDISIHLSHLSNNIDIYR